MYPKMLAIEITEESYPVAVACLASGFAGIPFRKVEGRMLVINDFRPPRYRRDEDRSLKSLPILDNAWMSKDRFGDEYEYVGKNIDPTTFNEVYKK